jgi:nicotinamide-nucleotide amidase
VSQGTLEEFGAVSEETAVEMALGAVEVSGTDMGISITGIAGPDGGSEAKPVGTAYICVSYKGENVVRNTDARDRGRKWNRNWFCLAMYDLINTVIDNNFLTR